MKETTKQHIILKIKILFHILDRKKTLIEILPYDNFENEN